jgi:hypothetical protein
VGTTVRTTFSVDQGVTWSAPVALSGAGEGFVWPSHNSVAPNGDVYVAYHSQPTFAGNAPNGTSGQVFVLRSTDGGATYPQKNTAFTPGNADITFNVQTSARTLNQSASWTQGSAQPWVLPDPVLQDNVYVIAADDPTNLAHGGANDDMDVFIVRSTDRGVNWSAPARVDSGPVGTTQFFPTAAIDFNSQFLTVTWYDTRNAATNAGGNFLLDVFLRSSTDGGLTSGPEVQINDNAFDPDLGAGTRFVGPPPTLRIGEYNGVSVINGISHAVWTGNTATGQQILFDSLVVGGPVDVYFLVDLSASFGDDLATFQDQSEMIIDNLLADNLNIQFGLGRFEDYPISPFGSAGDGDEAYEKVENLTFTADDVKATISNLSIRDGGDLPQSQLTALYQTASGAGQTVGTYTIPSGQQANFRNGATKLIILWTDAEFHVPTDAGGTYPGVSFATAAAAVLALDPPLVIGVSSGTAGIPDLETITTMTNSFAPPGGVDCDGDGLIDLFEGDPLVCTISETGLGIDEAIRSTVEAVTLPTADAGGDQTVECSSPTGTPVTLDGSGSSDPEGDPLVFTWTAPFAEGSGTATGVSPTVTLPLGTHEIMLTVFDGKHGSNSDTVIITAEDTLPPVMSCPDSLHLFGANCLGFASVPLDPAFAEDVCGSVTLEASPPTVPCGLAETVTITATNGSGNVAQCSIPVTVECRDPSSQGHWHRQCLGVPFEDGGIDPGRKGRGPQEPTEPEFFKELMPEVGIVLQDELFEFGGTCQGGIATNPPSEPCERALKQVTALLLNVASERLEGVCELEVAQVGCASTNVADLVDELAALVTSGDPDNCRQAVACASAVNENTGIVLPARHACERSNRQRASQRPLRNHAGRWRAGSSGSYDCEERACGFIGLDGSGERRCRRVDQAR